MRDSMLQRTAESLGVGGQRLSRCGYVKLARGLSPLSGRTFTVHTDSCDLKVAGMRRTQQGKGRSHSEDKDGTLQQRSVLSVIAVGAAWKAEPFTTCLVRPAMNITEQATKSMEPL